MYKDLSIEQYDGLLSSKSATPGGGSALRLHAAGALPRTDAGGLYTVNRRE